MALVGSFAGISIDSSELVSFGLEIAVQYSHHDRPFNSTFLTHTGLGARRLRFAVKLSSEAAFNPWLGLHENYDKLPKQFILAQNNEGFWIIESIDLDWSDFAAQQWRVSVSLIG